jgi:hypothetical protein
MVYDFRNGKTAKFIENEIQERIKRTSSFNFEPSLNVSYRLIKTEGKYFFYQKNEDKCLMFAYLNKYNTKKYDKLPSYHICKCPTRNEFTGFVFASKMPVSIYCKDRGENIGEQDLPLCENCISESNKGILRWFAKGKPWYEYVLEYANYKTFTQADKKKDGYVHIWKQLSEAKRESSDWCCENCNIELKSKELKLFLEVHHKDKKPLNNKTDNLQSLCILCHADKHPNNYSSGDNLLRIQQFIKFNTDLIKKHSPDAINKWLNK